MTANKLNSMIGRFQRATDPMSFWERLKTAWYIISNPSHKIPIKANHRYSGYDGCIQSVKLEDLLVHIHGIGRFWLKGDGTYKSSVSFPSMEIKNDSR